MVQLIVICDVCKKRLPKKAEEKAIQNNYDEDICSACNLGMLEQKYKEKKGN